MSQLSLDRKVGETIVIDPGGLNIVVKHTGLRGGRVRILIDCPRDIVVLRGELLDPQLKVSQTCGQLE